MYYIFKYTAIHFGRANAGLAPPAENDGVYEGSEYASSARSGKKLSSCKKVKTEI